jgi:hypothetical protein
MKSGGGAHNSSDLGCRYLPDLATSATITVRVALPTRRRAVRKVILAPIGADGPWQARARDDEAMTRHRFPGSAITSFISERNTASPRPPRVASSASMKR